jgi:hypothetical protein
MRLSEKLKENTPQSKTMIVRAHILPKQTVLLNRFQLSSPPSRQSKKTCHKPLDRQVIQTLIIGQIPTSIILHLVQHKTVLDRNDNTMS